MHPCQYFTHFAFSLVLGYSNFNNTYFNGFRFFWDTLSPVDQNHQMRFILLYYACRVYINYNIYFYFIFILQDSPHQTNIKLIQISTSALAGTDHRDINSNNGVPKYICKLSDQYGR